jgi:hypothetical protein
MKPVHASVKDAKVEFRDADKVEGMTTSLDKDLIH